jgi:hypothetical protein
VYRCGAASNAVSIDPSGHFEACPISRATSLPWRELGGAAAWQGLAAEAERRHHTATASGAPGEVHDCGACSARGGCSRCPGKSWMEAGDVALPVAQHCDISLIKIGLVRRSA